MGQTIGQENEARLFADAVWDYIKERYFLQYLERSVSFYRATVTEAPANGKVKIQRPFDAEIEVRCASSADGLAVGDDCLVLSFGSASNAVAICDAALRRLPSAESCIYLADCASSASAEAKVATVAGEFDLRPGVMVRVRFVSGNTYNGTTTLNVNGAGAKPIYRTTGSASTRYLWSAGEAVDFSFDGERFVMVRGGVATTTYYGTTKLSSSTSSTSTSLAATPSAVKSAYDKAVEAGRKYVLHFSASDMSQVSSGYSISVPAATHGAGEAPLTDLYTLNGSNYSKPVGANWRLDVAQNGDVTLFAESAFAGRLIIRG